MFFPLVRGTVLSSSLWNRIKSPTSPYIRFFYGAVQTAVFLFAIVMLVRILALGFTIVGELLPIQANPEDAKSYLPFSITRFLATILEVAAILTFVIVQSVQLIKLSIEIRGELSNWKLMWIINPLMNKIGKYTDEEIIVASKELKNKLTKEEIMELILSLSKEPGNE